MPTHQAVRFCPACGSQVVYTELTEPDLIEHLGRAIELFEGIGKMASDDSDFDPIRDEPAFKELVS
jgi:hypothetical protein